jgi:[acyl-carrier-protein] S-malonyltransferase
MDRVAWMFPGQGSQRVGMGLEIYESNGEARELYQRAEEFLGFPLRKISFEGPLEKLTETRFAQPALYVLEAALFLYLKRKFELPHVFFGHSLGEFTALFASGVFDFETGLKLVKLRGELMHRAGEKYPGTMAAIIGLPEEEMMRIIDEIEGVLTVANYNTPEQLVISGEINAVQRAMELAEGRGAKRVVKLTVSAAFHSPLMEEPSKRFEEILEGVEFNPPLKPVIPNSTGEITTDVEEIKKALMKQLRSPVLFVKTLKGAYKRGVNTFVEIGPGRVLQGLVRRTLREVDVYGFEKPGDEEKFGGLR